MCTIILLVIIRNCWLSPNQMSVLCPAQLWSKRTRSLTSHPLHSWYVAADGQVPGKGGTFCQRHLGSGHSGPDPGHPEITARYGLPQSILREFILKRVFSTLILIGPRPNQDGNLRPTAVLWSRLAQPVWRASTLNSNRAIVYYS